MIRFVHQLESSRPKQHPVGMTAIYPTGRQIDLEQSPADWISPNINAGYETDPPASNGKKVIISDTDHLFGLGGDRFWVWKTFHAGHQSHLHGWLRLRVGVPDSGNTQDTTWEDVRRNLGYTADYAARVDLATMVPRDELSSSRYCLARTTGDRPAYLAYTRMAPPSHWTWPPLASRWRSSGSIPSEVSVSPVRACSAGQSRSFKHPSPGMPSCTSRVGSVIRSSRPFSGPNVDERQNGAFGSTDSSRRFRSNVSTTAEPSIDETPLSRDRSRKGKMLSGVTTPSTLRASVRLTTGRSPPLSASRSSTTSIG